MMLPYLLLAMVAAVPDETAMPSARAACEDSRLHRVKPGAPVMQKRLTELPPAERIYTVERRVGGCSKPVLVRDERSR